MTTIDVNLTEWETAGPDQRAELRHLHLGDDASRRAADALSRDRRITVLELAGGLQVETTSYVGSVALGPLRIAVQPKVGGDSLLKLLRYAFRLRSLERFDPHEQAIARFAFADILLHQLAAEAMELLARGLHRRYVPVSAWLSAPRGRIEFDRLAAHGGAPVASLPCRHYPRLEDCAHNQVLLAGLQAGARLAADPVLRTRLRRLAKRLADGVSLVPLDRTILDRAQGESSRLTGAYASALSLIAILMQDVGVSPAGTDRRIRVPGFLFDMNLFWEQLMGRFLTEHLDGYQVESQRRLRGMLTYLPGFNPRNRPAQVPRPDFVVTESGRVKAILDAKYRDLWERPVPREMLYQLLVYALSHKHCTEAAILYPTSASAARESKVQLRDPVAGVGRATVVLRPVYLGRLLQLVASRRTVKGQRESARYAQYLAFGRDA